MIGGFLLGLIFGLAMGVALYREAYEYFREKHEKDRKHRKHLDNVEEWERRKQEGKVEAYVR